MSDISKITLPSGTTYDIKDATARQLIDNMSSYTDFLGVTTTALTDGSTTNPITIGGSSKTARKGSIVTYGSSEFIFNGTQWQAFGNLSGLGALAYKDSVQGSITPAGTVSKPTFSGTEGNISVSGTAAGSVATTYNTTSSGANGNFTPGGTVSTPTISVQTAGSTTTIKNPTSVTVAKTLATAAPGATAPSNAITYYAVSGETLSLYQIGYTTGASITTSDVTVKTGDAAYKSSQPTFTGTKLYAHHTFTGSSNTSTGKFTPAGTVSQPTFTGTSTTITSE